MKVLRKKGGKMSHFQGSVLFKDVVCMAGTVTMMLCSISNAPTAPATVSNAAQLSRSLEFEMNGEAFLCTCTWSMEYESAAAHRLAEFRKRTVV